MADILGRKAFREVGGRDDGPHLGLNAVKAENLRGVDGGHAEADMADVPVGGEVFIGENYLAHAAIRVRGARSRDTGEEG